MKDILFKEPCKVLLEDFEYKRDLNLRLSLENLSSEEILVVEEVLYSPLKVSIEDIALNLEIRIDILYRILDKISCLGLFSISEDKLIVNKEIRKYLEIAIEKFTDDFIPNLEYFKNILKLVPIHCLVSWFHISKTSNDIFYSILDKHFKNPKTYQYYIKETLINDEKLFSLFNDLCNQKSGMILASDIEEKYFYTKEELEEKILFLEFHGIASSKYEIMSGEYKKYISLFSEWVEWNNVIKKQKKNIISIPVQEISCSTEHEFSFIKDMAIILDLTDKEDIRVRYNQKNELFFLKDEVHIPSELSESSPFYVGRLINKNLLLGLLVIEEESLKQTTPAKKWLETPIKKRALITFKHPHNSISHKSDFSLSQHDRNIIEVQKALAKVKPDIWITFDDYIYNYLFYTNNLKQAELKKIKGVWKYDSAKYNKNEIDFVKIILFDWLYESGIIMCGKYKETDCFKVTSLGYDLYAKG